MIFGKTVLALTPARGGSKGLPGKNIRPMCGKPLLAYSIEVARASQYIDHIVVSTDSDSIARVAEEYGANVSMRPAHLASDTALVADVIHDLVDRLDADFDYMVILEATSPLRTVALVDRCIDQIVSSGADSVATFSHADPPPTRLWKIDGDEVRTYLDNVNPWLPRQQQDEAYFMNGLVYAFDLRAFLDSGSNSVFFGKRAAVVTEGISVDIDTLNDFLLAEQIMRMKNENPG